MKIRTKENRPFNHDVPSQRHNSKHQPSNKWLRSNPSLSLRPHPRCAVKGKAYLISVTEWKTRQPVCLLYKRCVTYYPFETINDRFKLFSNQISNILPALSHHKILRSIIFVQNCLKVRLYLTIGIPKLKLRKLFTKFMITVILFQ